MGVLVLGLAAAFLAYGLWTGGGGLSPRGYEVTAKFGEVGSLTPGAAVTVAGVKIGTVSRVTLEPDTYLAKVGLAIDPEVRLPADSTAKITSDSLLGGVHVAIGAGGAPEDLKPGGEIENTQGAVDLFGLIGQVVRPPAPAPESE
jgi:phospholipid/cholesterol/gamma-HCH transport system substrate-binding protein